MRVLSRKALDRVPDEEIGARMSAATARLRELEQEDPAEVVRQGKADANIAEMERLLGVLGAAEAELAERAAQHRGTVLQGTLPVRQAEREREESKRKKAPLLAALQFIARREHRVLGNAKLRPSALTADEAAEVIWLAKAMQAAAWAEDAEPLSETQIARYEALVGLCAGEAGIFARRREEAAARAKLREMSKARRRLPQSESLVGATFADVILQDFLRERVREDVTVVDEYGRESTETTVERILELEHISTLFVLVSLIAENGGRPITVNQHGAIRGKQADGRLPFIDPKTFAQLRRNGFLAIRREGSDYSIALGPRVRALAEKWGIELPAE